MTAATVATTLEVGRQVQVALSVRLYSAGRILWTQSLTYILCLDGTDVHSGLRGQIFNLSYRAATDRAEKL